jgi:hypothetical protein
MINHRIPSKANVHMDWFQWNDGELAEKFSKPVEELMNEPFAPLG